MKGLPFKHMRDSAMEIVIAVEDANRINGFEENLAIVTFGGKVDLVQSLTVEYDRLKRVVGSLKPGGRTPLSDAIHKAYREIRENGGRLRVNDRVVPSRIIIITDGLATDENTSGPDLLTEGRIDGKVRMSLMSKVAKYCRNKELVEKQPTAISCIGCGNSFDKLLLKSIADMGLGATFSAEQHDLIRRKIGGYYKTISIVYKFAATAQCQDKQVFRSFVQGSLGEEFDDEEWDEMCRVLDTLPPAFEDSKDENDETDEGRGLKELPNRPTLGSRVKRGPDWKWGNQDTEGPGTVEKHNKDDTLTVRWDNGEKNRYRFGSGGAYDVWQVDEQRKLTKQQMIETGVRVMRGPDWIDGDTDGGKGHQGTVFKVQKDGNVFVRWKNGNIRKYRFSSDGKFDVQIVEEDKYEGSRETPYSTPSKHVAPTVSKQVAKKHAIWERQENVNGPWSALPMESSRTVEAAFHQNNMTGTVTYTNTDNSDINVDFVRFEEYDDLYSTHHPIRRRELTDEEYAIEINDG